MKEINGHQIIQIMEQLAPKKYAMKGDPIGLQVGALNKPIRNVMVALDVLENVVDEAIDKKVDMIIAHHPMIYRPLKKISLDDVQGRIIQKLIKHDITVFAAHTNLDVAKGGVNDLLAEALALQDISVLMPTETEELRKLVVYAPMEDKEKILMTLGDNGAGHLGNYSHCSFTSEGTGRFLPGESTNPHIGEQGKMEVVHEVRIETIYPVHLEKKIIQAMIKAHPYEEPAYDIYPLALKGEDLGLGRVGSLTKEMSLGDFARFVKEKLESSGVRVVGDLSSRVKKVAVLGGDGNKYFQTAKIKGADVYVTGDFYYHTAHDAMNIGLNIVDPGHNVEKIMKKGLTQLLQHECKERHYDVQIFPSEVNTDPFTFI